MNKHHISVKRALEIIRDGGLRKKDLVFPYKVPIREDDGKITRVNQMDLNALLKAITLTGLDHPLTEERPEPMNEEDIVAVYIFGSSINPVYRKIKKSYLFGLFSKETLELDVSNDIDICCFVKNWDKEKQVKSISSWTATFSDGYGGYDKTRYANFEITFFPYQLTQNPVDENDGVRNHIANHGICLMGDNVMKTKKYAIWSHDVIKKRVSCVIPRSENIKEFTPQEEIKTEDKENRFELMDI